MPSHQMPQESAADVRRSYSPGHLIIAEVPAAAPLSLIGKSLLDAGALSVIGTYTCFIDTHDWGDIEVVVKASAVTGTIPVTLSRMYANGVAVRESATPVNLTTAAQEMVLAGLAGSTRCRVTFVLDGVDSMTFANTVPATPTSLAEYNGR